MTDKVYILVNVANGKVEQVAEILRRKNNYGRRIRGSA